MTDLITTAKECGAHLDTYFDETTQCAIFTPEAIAAFAERIRAEAIEEAGKDAKRYQWLREQPNTADAPRIDVVHWTQEDEASNSGEGLRLEALDAAIDAAIRAQKESNG